MTCLICCEDYTDKLRRPITCLGCKKDVCLVCFKRHLLDNRSLDCMFPDCDKVFSFPEITKLTNNIKFSNEIMDKLGLIALEEEKNYLPQRQKIAKRRLEEQKYELRRIERSKNKTEINKERFDLETKIRESIRHNKELNEFDRKLRELKAQKAELQKELYDQMTCKLKPFYDKIKSINEEDSLDRRQLGLIDKKENNYTFIKQCSFQGCKGFLENNPEDKGWKCSLCDKFTCRKCHEPLVSTIVDGKKQKHQCNEDVVKNIKELKKDTKPCPKCGTAIFKIDGCFSKDTIIPIYDQVPKFAKDIVVGDVLIGPDLLPRKVLETFSGTDDMYLVEQENASNYIVNSQHILLLKYTNCYLSKKIYKAGYEVFYGINKKEFFDIGTNFNKIYKFLEEKKNEVIEITVAEYLKLPEHIQRFLQGFKINGQQTNINISYLGREKYYGFTISHDNRFILKDQTVVKNCNMMFCISCQTYFDWVSGKIYKRGGHNPEAVRWMQDNGTVVRREEGDDGCTDPFEDNFIYYNWMHNNARPYLVDAIIVYYTIMDMVNFGAHINGVILPRFNDIYGRKSEDSAVDYLIDETYSEFKWTRDIRKYKKQQMLNEEYNNIISFLLEVMRTILSNLRQMVDDRSSIEDIITELEIIPKVVEECNQKIEDVKTCFNSKRKQKFIIRRSNKKLLFSISYN